MKKYIKDVLKKDERVWAEASESVISLMFVWLSVPVFLMCFYLPPLLGIIKKGKTLIDFLQAFGVQGGVIEEFFGVAKPVITFALIMLSVLVTVWLAFCIVMTIRHFGYELVCTDYRVIGKAKRKFLISPWSSVQNVFVERSWLGKLFGYGTITVSTKRESFTFRNIKKPEEMKSIILSRIENWD